MLSITRSSPASADNVAFLAALCRAESFREGKVDTGFIDRNLAALGAVPHEPDRAAAALGVVHLLDGERCEKAGPERRRNPIRRGPHATAFNSAALAGSKSRSWSTPRGAATVSYGKDGMRVMAGDAGRSDARVFVAGRGCHVCVMAARRGCASRTLRVAAARPAAATASSRRRCTARCWSFSSASGEAVTGGQRLAVLEAMKMEHTLRAPFAGTVRPVLRSSSARKLWKAAQIMVIERSERSKLPPWRCTSSSSVSAATRSSDLEGWIKQRIKEKRRRGEKPEHIHRTRMVPKRAAESIDGGSLFWVIRGEIACRQRIRVCGRSATRTASGVAAWCSIRRWSGRAAAVSRLPGLALPRGQGRAPRSRKGGTRRDSDAGEVAAGVAPTRPDVSRRPALRTWSRQDDKRGSADRGGAASTATAAKAERRRSSER